MEQVDVFTSAPKIAEYLRMYQTAWWPDGILAEPYPPRSAQEKHHTKMEARTKLLGVMTGN